MDRTTAVGAAVIFCAVLAAGLPFAVKLGGHIAGPTVVYTRPAPYDSPNVRLPRQPVAPQPAVTRPWSPRDSRPVGRPSGRPTAPQRLARTTAAPDVSPSGSAAPTAPATPTPEQTAPAVASPTPSEMMFL